AGPARRPKRCPMTTDRSPGPPHPRPVPPLGLDSEEDVRALLEEAGPRPDPPADDLARVRAAARQEWERVVDEERARSRRRRVVFPAALAAGLLLAVAALWWLATASWQQRRPAPPSRAPVLASVRQVVGSAWSEEGRSGASHGARRPLRA